MYFAVVVFVLVDVGLIQANIESITVAEIVFVVASPAVVAYVVEIAVAIVVGFDVAFAKFAFAVDFAVGYAVVVVVVAVVELINY